MSFAWVRELKFNPETVDVCDQAVFFSKEADVSKNAPDEDVLVIQGMREDGVRLRPSNWMEMISSTLASFGSDHRLHYSQSVQPCMVEGEKCLVVAWGLEQSNPEAYEYIIHFARSNRLKIVTDRRKGYRALMK